VAIDQPYLRNSSNAIGFGGAFPACHFIRSFFNHAFGKLRASLPDGASLFAPAALTITAPDALDFRGSRQFAQSSLLAASYRFCRITDHRADDPIDRGQGGQVAGAAAVDARAIFSGTFSSLQFVSPLDIEPGLAVITSDTAQQGSAAEQPSAARTDETSVIRIIVGALAFLIVTTVVILVRKWSTKSAPSDLMHEAAIEFSGRSLGRSWRVRCWVLFATQPRRCGVFGLG
jgi:hypothetical protein